MSTFAAGPQLEMLTQLGWDLVSHQDLRGALSHAVTTLAQHSGLQVGIGVCDGAGALTCQSTAGLTPADLLEAFLVAISQAPLHGPQEVILPSRSVPGYLVHLQAGANCSGFLFVRRADDPSWRLADLKWLETVGVQLGLGLTNLLLSQTSRTALAEKSLLLELANLTGEVCSLADQLQRVCRAVKDCLGVDCAVMLTSPANGYLIGEASSFLAPDELRHLRAAPGRSALFSAFDNGFVHVPRLGDHPNAPAWGRSGEFAEHGQLVVPVVYRETNLGVLMLTGTSLHTVTSEFVSLSRAIGQQVGVAVSNAQVHDRLTRQAMTDELTCLGNHRRFQERLSALATGEGPTTLILLDIDHFKHFNDTFGHQAGDRLMRAIAPILCAEAGPDAVVCRHGGEEFAVILPGQESEQGYEVAERIRRAVAQQLPQVMGLPEYPLTVSGGVSCYPDHANTKDGLIALADLALYDAKTRGRNRTRLYRSASGALRANATFREAQTVPTMKTLSSLIRAKDKYTYAHSVRVARTASALARQMGLPDDEVRMIEYGALVHDIGKLEIDRQTLTKPDRLTGPEWGLIKQHSTWGAELLADIPLLNRAIPQVRWHHERWDGSGYPDGLAGERIPLAARIMAVADSLDAMTHVRAYQAPKTHAQALEELRRCAGTQFDPAVVEAYLEMAGARRRLSLTPAGSASN